MASDMRAFLGCSTDLFTVLGVACAACLCYKLLSSSLNGIKVFFLSRSLGLSADLKRMGSWAVVTGATDGIGKAYAEQLAKLGLNIVLISRSLDKLQNVAKEIESAFKVKTKYIAADFSRGTEIYPGIKSELEGLDVGVLVNNVGMSYHCPGRVLDFENVEKLSFDLINVNITSMTMMTNIVLPGMVDRRKGAVINISSLSGMRPMPWLSIYSACKAYVDFYSVCIQQEYKSAGIIAQSVMPGFVSTNMSGIRRTSLMVPSANSYVRSALATVGLETRTHGCWTHAVLAYVMEKMPDWLYYRNAISNLSAARARYLKKKQQQSKTE